MSQTAERVTKSVTKNLGRRGAWPALLTALGVAAFLVMQNVLSSLVTMLGLIGTPTQTTVDGLEQLEVIHVSDYIWQGVLTQTLIISLPLAFGVFVSFWILAPIGEELQLRFVVARSVLAGAVGAVIIFLVAVISALVGSIESGGILSSWSFSPYADFFSSALQALTTALGSFVFTLPLVILGGVLLWTWTRHTDREHDPSGILDEV
ncbi:hypothetical protein EYE40_06305 [Glaciihabitans arcticus]|uniref:Uncharacterized protein n=1 Tax=Glaciihabitans arcticus TaxID=2668039 RepID=A0A4Q9GQ98_9MICO|nr:hypothetical protein [Glaciihabitans arcticus]TBN57042.1 hypothetical protein EYE40_06305 [Glaciihabitans arcticus]